MDERIDISTFLQALELGDLPAIKRFVEFGKNVNETCSNGLLPLAIIVKQIVDYRAELSTIEKYIAVLNYLLQKKADPNVAIFAAHYSDKTTTPLQLLISCTSNSDFNLFDRKINPANIALINTAICKLIAAGADLEAPDEFGFSPLFKAIQCDNLIVVEMLIASGASTTSAIRGTPLLHYACHLSMAELVPILLKNPSIDITEKNAEGLTALDIAYSYCRPNILLMLLARNCPYTRFDLIDLFDQANRFASSKTADAEYQALMDYLLNQGIAKQCKKDGTTALHHALTYETASLLIQHGADVHAVNGNGETPLLSLVTRHIDDTKLFELFINHGASIKDMDKEDNTILHRIIPFNCFPDLVKFFVQKGAEVNAQNKLGQAPLHKAIETLASPEVINELLLNGATPNLQDKNNKTALEYIHHLPNEKYISPVLSLLKSFPKTKLPKNADLLIIFAARYICYALLEELSLRGANMSAGLITAVDTNNKEMTGWLLAHDADANYLPVPQSLLPLQIAIETGAIEIAILLIEHGAELEAKDINGQSFLDLFLHYIFQLAPNKAEFTNEEKLLGLLLGKNIPINPNIRRTLLYSKDNYITGHCAATLYRRRYIKLNTVEEGRKLIIYCFKYKKDYRQMLKQLQIDFADISPIYNIAAQYAIAKNNLKLLDELLDLGLNINQYLAGIDSYAWGRPRPIRLVEYAFEMAAKTHNPAVLRYFISRNASLHFPNADISYFFSTAIKNQWEDIITLLLSPACGFQVDMRFKTDVHSSFNTSSLLEIAVQEQRVSMVKFLLQYNPNINITKANGHTLLHITCQKGDIATTQVLLEAGITIKKANAIFPLLPGEWPIESAIESKIDNEAKHLLIELLLQYQHPVSILTLQLAIVKKLDIKTIYLFVNRLTIETIVENRLLHTAVYFKHLGAVEILIKKTAALLINTQNNKGQTPLHLAAKNLDKEIYNMLLQAGSSIATIDHLGYRADQYLFLYNNDYSSLPELDKLIANISDESEFQNIQEAQFNRAHYGYLLIRLFKTADVALKYISKYRNKESKQPLHDLCQFNLPTTDNWNVHLWAILALQHGPKITEYLHIAPRIEQLSPSPLSLETIQATAATIKYNREQENPNLAALFRRYNVPERGFERVLNEYRPKERDEIPDITIDGVSLGDPRYYLKKSTGMEGFVLGAMTGCCQSVGSPGEACAWHGMTSPYGGFYVIYMRPNENDVQKAKTLLDKAEQAKSLKEFTEGMPKAQKEKYIKKYGENILLLRKELAAKHAQLNEHRPIAQLWTWIGTNPKHICLDSFERQYPQDDRLCPIFVSAVAEKLINEYGFEAVYLGLDGNTPPNLPYDAAEILIQPKDYLDYRDSIRRQAIVATCANKISQSEMLLQHSALFTPPAATAIRTYSAAEVSQLLNCYLSSVKDICLLPYVGKEQLKEHSFKFPQLPPVNSLKGCYLLPIQEDENWACVIIKPNSVIYLNMQATCKSGSLLNWLQANYNPHKPFAKFHIQYETNSFFSSVRLLSVLKQYLSIGSLDIDKLISVPINDLIIEQEMLLKPSAAISSQRFN